MFERNSILGMCILEIKCRVHVYHKIKFLGVRNIYRGMIIQLRSESELHSHAARLQ